MIRGLTKGDNAFVPTAALRLAVRNDVDVAVLLVTEQGRVRGDEDVVFEGAPAHPSGAVRLSEAGVLGLGRAAAHGSGGRRRGRTARGARV
ncbi:TerD family protein [Streptomyces stackebrandtii]|uniref:TerD family protein n=1 Tax=Streptomyces stackebrandtii TaxID=3051177 RepID=UPI0028DD054A|nr:TerD family protein [Streptomyces sp. DSM 40976]